MENADRQAPVQQAPKVAESLTPKPRNPSWQVMGAKQELQTAVAWAAQSLDFGIDRRVHVFELTIRALGGLLSAHALIEADPSLVPGADSRSTMSGLDWDSEPSGQE